MLLLFIGLSVGDELGFTQSLSNVEGNKRRSASGGELAIAAAEVSTLDPESIIITNQIQV